MLVVMILSFQAFVQRVPFDISEAETELMEGPLMEYSGPKLALFKYAQMAKLVNIQCAVCQRCSCPGARNSLSLAGLLSGHVLGEGIRSLVLLVTLVAATHARYRIDQAIRFFAGLFAVALGALVPGELWILR